MICQRCRQKVHRFLPHRCRVAKASPVQLLGDSTAAQALGSGPDWALPKYGEYYPSSPLVYAAVKLRAEAITRAALRVYQTASGGARQEVEPSHPLAQLLARVNPYWTGIDLWRGTSTYLDLWGSAFWALTKASPTSPPTELWLVRPDRMRIMGDRNNYLRGFEYQTFGSWKPLRPDEVLWFRHFNPLDELAGLSPVAPVRLSADMAADALRHNRQVFKNGLLPDTVITTNFTPTEEEVQAFEARLKKRFAAPENSHKPIILGEGMEVKNLALSSREMEYMASLRWCLEDVCRVYGIPKPLMHDLERATYSNIDAAERIFWRHTIVPYLSFLAAEVNEMLAPQFGPGLEVAFDLSQIEALQQDVVTIAEMERQDVEMGILTINEVRAKRGLEPLPWGDAYWVPWGKAPVLSTADSGTLPAADQGPPGPIAGAASLPPPIAPIESGRPGWTIGTGSESESGWQLWPKHQAGLARSARIDHSRDHLALLEVYSGHFAQMQSRLFAQQRAEVLRRLGQRPDSPDSVGVPMSRLCRDADVSARRDSVIRDADINRRFDTLPMASQKDWPDPIFDPKDWLKRFVDAAGALFGTLVLAAARQKLLEAGLPGQFDPDDRAVTGWLGERLSLWATLTNEETARLLLQEIVEGERLGEGIKKLQGRAEKVFDFSDTVRSERIARTEVQSLSNFASVEAYRQSKEVGELEWLTTLDGRERLAHHQADGQRVVLGTPFIVGGEALRFPGDPRGSAENTINCRCSTIPILTNSPGGKPTAGRRGLNGIVVEGPSRE